MLAGSGQKDGVKQGKDRLQGGVGRGRRACLGASE